MTPFIKKYGGKLLACWLCWAMLSGSAAATGMQPEYKVLLADDKKGGFLRITNTDSVPALLKLTFSSPSGASVPLLASPSLAQLAPGQTQLVRFFYQGEPLSEQHYFRLQISSLPAFSESDRNRSITQVSVGQNIPVIISPAALEQNLRPWENLRLINENGQRYLANNSPYIVRLNSVIRVGSRSEELPRYYLLPGEKKIVKGKGEVKIRPISVYGVMLANDVVVGTQE